MDRKVYRTTSILVALLLFYTGNIPVYASSPNSHHGHFTPGVSVLKIALAANQPPVIDVWYESNLKFGAIGNPQRQVNILGNIFDEDCSVGSAVSLKSLRYSLNGRPSVSLGLGPNTTRLVGICDFNVSLDTSLLKDGNNSLVLTATDSANAVQFKTVNFSYKRGGSSPFPYQSDWSKSSVIQDQAQVVDGAWSINTNTGEIYPIQLGYDRVVAIGDMSWTDYEVKVPVTIHAFIGDASDPGGVGIITRWQGHTGSGQPPIGWNQIGSYGYYSYREKALALRLDGAKPITQPFDFAFNTTYIFKLKVESTSAGAKYSLKVWEKGQPEPSWASTQFNNIVNVVDGTLDMPSGSVLLVAHKAEATFGNVLICPVGAAYSINVNKTTGGKVTTQTGKMNFACGEQAQVTAVPDPGYLFSGWTGSVSGTQNPITLNMLKSYNLTAKFTPKEIVPPDLFKLFLPLVK